MTPMKFLFASLALSAISLPALAAPLTVTIEDIEARGGTLYISVQTREQFMQNDGIDGSMIPAPVAGTKSVTYDLEPGEYSISVWHDFNGNDVFDRAENGMPLDGWAMIGGKSMRAAPTFDTASVTLSDAGATITEAMIYPAK